MSEAYHQSLLAVLAELAAICKGREEGAQIIMAQLKAEISLCRAALISWHEASDAQERKWAMEQTVAILRPADKENV